MCGCKTIVPLYVHSMGKRLHVFVSSLMREGICFFFVIFITLTKREINRNCKNEIKLQTKQAHI